MSQLLLSASIGAILDGAGIFVICAFIIIGARKGFVKTFFTVFGGFFSLLFAVLLCGSVAKTLESHFGLITTFSAKINGSLTGIFGDQIMNTPLSESGSVSDRGIAGWILDLAKKLGGTGEIEGTTTLGEIICPVFAYYMVAILGAIVLYIVFRLIFFVIGEIVHKLHAFTAIRVTDNVLGAVLGVLRGVIIVQGLLMIIKFIPLSFCQQIIAEIPSTFLIRILYEGNIFEQIINALLNSNLTDFIISLVK